MDLSGNRQKDIVGGHKMASPLDFRPRGKVVELGKHLRNSHEQKPDKLLRNADSCLAVHVHQASQSDSVAHSRLDKEKRMFRHKLSGKDLKHMRALEL